jgi:hypothetical protein
MPAQPVHSEQRFHGRRRCPVCGADDEPQGTGSRGTGNDAGRRHGPPARPQLEPARRQLEA